MDPLVRLDQATRSYPRTGVALRPLSFTLARGELAYVVGASGSGKSTLLRLVAMTDPPTGGTVEVAGFSSATIRPRELPMLRRRLGVVFQDVRLLPDRTVEQNVAFALEVTGVPRREVWARAAHRLAQVGLASRGRAYPHELSGGEQQRVALARALAPGPRILLLDEPFSSLDVVLRQQVRQETISLLKRIGTSVLFVTHDPEEALYVADRVAVMREGLILQEAAPDDIYLKPASRFVAEFFGDTTIVPAQVRAGRADTPFGAMHAPGVPDGKADFVIRAAGLSLASAGNVEAIVRSARLLGPSLMVEVEPVSAGGLPRTLTARLPLGAKPAIGTRVYLALDPQLAFVFPAEA